MRKILLYFLLLTAVTISGFVISPFSREFLLNLGMVSEEVLISGTGSMYPTFPKSEGVSEKEAGNQIVARVVMKRYPGGVTLLGKSYFTTQIQRGDIVEFENDDTRRITKEKYENASGFVKRVIGLPGDEIELRDGYLYLNRIIQNEAYTAKPRSTYGGDFVSDCQEIKVPPQSVFVLGDNRKASYDSRFDLGFVKLTDIRHFLPVTNQDKYKNIWRDTSEDLKFARSSTLDPGKFVTLLNTVRTDKKLSPFKLNNFLNRSSAIRGKIILETDDFSSEATKSGINLEKSLQQANYRNIISAELFVRGFFDSEELIENLFEFPEMNTIFLSSEYQDIGLSPVLSDVNSCPTQVIVIHLGGYKPPNYQKKDIDSWRELITNLEEILPSWKNLTNADNIDRDMLSRLVLVLEERLTNAKRIHQKLSSNQWLTDEESQLVQKDKILHDEAEKIIGDLNN